jgi:hypothetical protein
VPPCNAEDLRRYLWRLVQQESRRTVRLGLVPGEPFASGRDMLRRAAPIEAAHSLVADW